MSLKSHMMAYAVYCQIYNAVEPTLFTDFVLKGILPLSHLSFVYMYKERERDSTSILLSCNGKYECVCVGKKEREHAKVITLSAFYFFNACFFFLSRNWRCFLLSL